MSGQHKRNVYAEAMKGIESGNHLMSEPSKQAVLDHMKPLRDQKFHESRQASLANPPYRKVRGGKTRRKQRKHRKTRHRR
jgi:hypothetical protein